MRLFLNHSGGTSSKCRLTGPKTPSTLYWLMVVKSESSQLEIGYSSSSIKARYSPDAFSTTLLRAIAMLRRGSEQYLIGTERDCCISAIADSADLAGSLSATTIE